MNINILCQYIIKLVQTLVKHILYFVFLEPVDYGDPSKCADSRGRDCCADALSRDEPQACSDDYIPQAVAMENGFCPTTTYKACPASLCYSCYARTSGNNSIC